MADKTRETRAGGLASDILIHLNGGLWFPSYSENGKVGLWKLQSSSMSFTTALTECDDEGESYFPTAFRQPLTAGSGHAEAVLLLTNAMGDH